jgi:hypothetical protein
VDRPRHGRECRFQSGASRSPKAQASPSSIDRSHAPFDFILPRILGIGICRTVEADQKFRNQSGTCIDVQSQGIGKDGVRSFGHTFDATPGFACQQALAAGGPRAHDCLNCAHEPRRSQWHAPSSLALFDRVRVVGIPFMGLTELLTLLPQRKTVGVYSFLVT